MPYTYTKSDWTNNSGQPLNETNLDKIEAGFFKANAHIGTSVPSDTDREWYDTNTNPPTLKVYSGGSWVAVSSGGGGYAMVQDEGSVLTQRATINFVGAGESLKAADRTTCNAADGWATSAGWFPTARYFDADKASTY